MRARSWALGLLPIGIFYVFFFIFPLFAFLGASFFQSAGPGRIDDVITLSNYTGIFQEPLFYRAIGRTLRLSATTAVISTLMAYPVAYAICHSRRAGRILFILVISTMFSSHVALALGWQALLADAGLINRILLASSLVMSPLPLANNYTAVVIGTVHAMLPIAVLALIPVCESLARDHLEAAAGLGASRWATFCQVILPQTQVGVITTAITVFAITTSAFTTPALLGGGRVALLPLLIREQLLQVFNYPSAAALATVLVVMVGILVVITRSVSRSYARIGPRAGVNQ